MKKRDHVILGVHVTDRFKRAEDVQHVLTRYGASIKTRIGLHEADGVSEARGGILLLELVGPSKNAKALAKGLDKIKGIEVQQMVFRHA